MTVFRGTISVIRTVVVELEQDGLKGYGEAYEDQHWGVTVEDMVNQIESYREVIQRYAFADPFAFNRLIQNLIRKYPYAATALEMAACDLWGKLHNMPLRRIWGFDGSSSALKSSYTLGLDSIYRVIEKFKEQPNWPLYRVKLGSHEDMTILRELRARTDSPFRLDVNGCWTLQQTLEYLDELKSLNIELIEQPLHQDDWEGMKRLRKECDKYGIPLIADESCRCERDLEKCVGFFHGVNLKPIKFGGLLPTKKLVIRARELGFKVMIGNTIESVISASATSQFVPMIDYAYIDGPLLVDPTLMGNQKFGRGVELKDGSIVFSSENGIGYVAPSKAVERT